MRNSRLRNARRAGRNDGSFWLSFSDLMSSLLLIIILILFYIMYQYFEMYEINMAEIARQQYDLDEANANLEAERTRLSEAEQQMLAQQIRLNAAEDELADAEAVLAQQRADLETAQALLAQSEEEVAQQQTQLSSLSDQLSAQQATLDSQQAQIEQLVGVRTQIIRALSGALREADISATVDPTSGAIALESDVLFATGEYALTERGRAWIDDFLPVYLDVLLSDEYRGLRRRDHHRGAHGFRGQLPVQPRAVPAARGGRGGLRAGGRLLGHHGRAAADASPARHGQRPVVQRSGAGRERRRGSRRLAPGRVQIPLDGRGNDRAVAANP